MPTVPGRTTNRGVSVQNTSQSTTSQSNRLKASMTTNAFANAPANERSGTWSLATIAAASGAPNSRQRKGTPHHRLPALRGGLRGNGRPHVTGVVLRHEPGIAQADGQQHGRE